MGRSTRWFLTLIGLKRSSKSSPDKKSSHQDETARKSSAKEKRRWSFGKSGDGLDKTNREIEQDQTKHAIAVAAASAAAAEAAVAAAQAAAAVVRLTGGGNYGHPVFELISREEWAAIKVQTAFRGYLAKRALRALKAVVRIQALFRGHRVRKQAAITLRCMQALVRVQARVRARRVRMSKEGQAVQQQLLERRQQQGRSRKSVDGWNASTGTVEDLQAKNERRQLGVIKRERALAYAFSQNHQRTSPMVIDCEPDTPHWGWSWLERWMAARPWENPFEAGAETSPVSGCTKIVEVDPAAGARSSSQQQQQHQQQQQQQQKNRNRPTKKRSGSASHESMDQHSPTQQLILSEQQNPSPVSVNEHHSGRSTAPTATALATIEAKDVITTKDVIITPDDNHDLNHNLWTTATTKNSPASFNHLKPLKNSSSGFDLLGSKDDDHVLLNSSSSSSFPNYMATTQSSKAKVRSHSTPKQRPELLLPDTPRKRSSMNGSFYSTGGGLESRSVSGGLMLRGTAQHHQQPRSGRGLSGSVILDSRSSLMSLKDGQAMMSVNGDLRKPFRY